MATKANFPWVWRSWSQRAPRLALVQNEMQNHYFLKFPFMCSCILIKLWDDKTEETFTKHSLQMTRRMICYLLDNGEGILYFYFIFLIIYKGT